VELQEDVILQAAPQWRTIGIMLLDQCIIKIIDCDTRGASCVEKIQILFEKWIDINENDDFNDNCKWSVLIAVLQMDIVGLGNLALDLIDKYRIDNIEFYE